MTDEFQSVVVNFSIIVSSKGKGLNSQLTNLKMPMLRNEIHSTDVWEVHDYMIAF